MPIPTGRPPFGGPGGPGGPGGNNGPGGPGSGGPGSGNNGPGNGGPGNGNNGPGNGGPGNGGPGNGGPNGPGNGNNGPGNGGPGNGNGNGPNGPGNGNNNGGRPTTTLATVTRPSVPSSTATSCPLPPFLTISTSLIDLLDLDLKLYLDLSSLTSGVGNLLDSVLPGLGSTVTNLLGADNQPASATNLPTTQRSRFRTLPCGTSLGSLPGGQTGTVPIDGNNGDNDNDNNNNNGDNDTGNSNGGDNGSDNGNTDGGNNNNNGPTSAIEECIKRCEADAIRASLELLTIRDCLGVTVDRRTTVDNCLWFVGPRGEKLPILDLGVAVDLTGLLGPGVESAVRDIDAPVADEQQ
ncbi:hypothetical protein B0T20DRAFT_416369 [Sordaria brevicollis]|uniref:Uncharacterized protein n=1 Tax=Sordaria brevicollis TaxID=83679 RepID=A0AAE0U9R3_SORBR|nr:hypothetical protein B0T20DRAFT_416369 [Sordaria brevicollis]